MAKRKTAKTKDRTPKGLPDKDYVQVAFRAPGDLSKMIDDIREMNAAGSRADAVRLAIVRESRRIEASKRARKPLGQEGGGLGDMMNFRMRGQEFSALELVMKSLGIPSQSEAIRHCIIAEHRESA